MIETLCLDALPLDSTGRVIKAHILEAIRWLQWNDSARACQNFKGSNSLQGKVTLAPSRAECIPGWTLVKDVAVDGVGRFSVFHGGAAIPGGQLLIRILFVDGARMEFTGTLSGSESPQPLLTGPTFRIVDPMGTSMERSWRLPVGCQDHATAALRFIDWLSIDDKRRDQQVESAQRAAELVEIEQHRINILRAKHCGDSLSTPEKKKEGILRPFAPMTPQQGDVMAKPSAGAMAQEALERSINALRSIEDVLR